MTPATVRMQVVDPVSHVIRYERKIDVAFLPSQGATVILEAADGRFTCHVAGVVHHFHKDSEGKTSESITVTLTEIP